MSAHRSPERGVRSPESEVRSHLEQWRNVRRLVALTAWFLAVCAPTPALCQPAPAAQPTAGAPAAPGVPVRLDGDVLFYVYQGVGTLTPAERAEALERRMVRIAEDPFYSEDEITVTEKGQTAQIFYRGTLVGLVTQEDAARAGRPTSMDLAAEVVNNAARSIERYRDRRQPVAARRAAVLAVAATLLLAASLLVLKRLHRALARLIEQAAAGGGQATGTAETALRFLGRSSARLRRPLLLLRVTIAVLLVASYLLAIFDLFPLTRGYAATIAGYFLDPLWVICAAIWDNIGNFIFIAVVAILARYLLKGIRLLLAEAAAGVITLPGVQADWALLLYKALRIVVVAVAAVMVYPYIPGSDTEAFKGIGLFAGALLTLGASGMAGNMIGGLVLAFSGTFRVGDRVKIGESIGDVIETTLLMTRVRSLRNEVVTIANSAILTGQVVNYTQMARTAGLLLTTEVTIGYDAPWRKVHALLVDAALRTRDIVAEPAPFVLQKSLNDYHVSYVLWAYTRDASRMHLTHAELHQNIQDAFNEGGVEILSPAFSYLRDGSTTTIPASYRGESYRTQPFTVSVETPGERVPSNTAVRDPTETDAGPAAT